MSEINFRRAGAEDVRLISALAITTCYEAYFELDPPHDLADYCFNFLSPEKTAIEFEDPASTFILAEIDGSVVGFAKLREGKPVECVADRRAIEVQRVYVLEKMKGRDVGRRLIDESAAIGRDRGYDLLWLGVWDKNVAAQRFYERIGMRKLGTTDFSDGKSEFLNFVYAKDL